MRASERLFEANFCSEIARREAPNRVFWFSPTQNAEANLAFDLLTAYGGSLAAFQMKAPVKELRPRVDAVGQHRRFQIELEHEQLMQLRANFGHMPNTAFYAFPAVFDVADYLAPGFDLLAHTYRFDISVIPAGFPPPTAHGKATPRANGKHLGNLDADANQLTIHSDPYEIEVQSMADAPLSRLDQPGLVQAELSERSAFVERVRSMRRLLLAIVSPPPTN